MSISDWGYWGSVMACSISYWLLFVWICWGSISFFTTISPLNDHVIWLIRTPFFVCLFYVLFLLQTHLPSPYPSPISSSEPTMNSVLLARKMMFKWIIFHAKSRVKLKAFERKFLVRRRRSVSWHSRWRRCWLWFWFESQLRSCHRPSI